MKRLLIKNELKNLDKQIKELEKSQIELVQRVSKLNAIYADNHMELKLLKEKRERLEKVKNRTFFFNTKDYIQTAFRNYFNTQFKEKADDVF